MFNAPFHVCEIFDDIDDKYNFTELLLTEILNNHAPLKSKKPLNSPNPYMNAELRKTIHYKSMLRNKYFVKDEISIHGKNTEKLEIKVIKLEQNPFRFTLIKIVRMAAM